MTMSAHIVDSCNYSKNDFFTWLFFPFTIRFHALHHLFPTIPYHNLEAAHIYLTENLPADSVYHTLDRPGWWHTAKQNLGLGSVPKLVSNIGHSKRPVAGALPLTKEHPERKLRDSA